MIIHKLFRIIRFIIKPVGFGLSKSDAKIQAKIVVKMIKDIANPTD